MRRKSYSRTRPQFETLEKRELLATFRWLGGNYADGVAAWSTAVQLV